MKRLLSILAIATLFITASSLKVVHNYNTPVDNKVEVVFNRQQNLDDLIKIKKDLSEKGIQINYKKLEFDDQGKLITIGFFVDCKDGFTGNAVKQGLNNQSRFGFYRDYTKETTNPFGVGELSE